MVHGELLKYLREISGVNIAFVLNKGDDIVFSCFSVLVAPTQIFISLECFKPLILETVQCAAVITKKRDIIAPPQKDQAFRLIIVA